MKDHIIFEKIDLYLNTIAKKETKEELNDDDLHVFNISLEYIVNRLNNTIPALVVEADLTNASNDLENSIVNLNTYLGNSNPGNLTKSINQIKSAVTRIKNLPFPIKGDNFNFSSEIESFKEIVSERIEENDNEIASIKEKVEELDGLISDRKEELTNLEDAIQTKTSELNNLNKSFEEQYDKDRAEHIAQIADQEDKIKTDTESLLAFLDKKKTDAAKIVNVIGNIGATGNFQNIANDHKKAANTWRVIAALLMVGLSGLIIWSVISLGGDNYDWTKSILRIIAAAALSYPATYASRESSKHRKLENYNRKLELELSSIDAFIELLPDEKKQTVKEKLAEKYFGATLDLFEDADLKSDKAFSLQAMERMIKAIEPLIKK